MGQHHLQQKKTSLQQPRHYRGPHRFFFSFLLEHAWQIAVLVGSFECCGLSLPSAENCIAHLYRVFARNDTDSHFRQRHQESRGVAKMPCLRRIPYTPSRNTQTPFFNAWMCNCAGSGQTDKNLFAFAVFKAVFYASTCTQPPMTKTCSTARYRRFILFSVQKRILAVSFRARASYVYKLFRICTINN